MNLAAHYAAEAQLRDTLGVYGFKALRKAVKKSQRTISLSGFTYGDLVHCMNVLGEMGFTVQDVSEDVGPTHTVQISW